MKIKRVAVFAFIYEGKIFLQERGNYSKRGEEWAFFGGHLEEGETFFEWCKREVKEELCLDIDDVDIQFVWKFYTSISEVSEIDVEVFLSHAYKKYKANLKVMEWDSGQFFSFEEVKKLKMFFHDPVIFDMIQQFLHHEGN